jgi:uncharacterized protein
MLSTNYMPGAPIWTDLAAPDVDSAAAFYRALFGWEFQSYGPDAGGYGALTLDGRIAAGLGPVMGEGARPAWIIYFYTQDANATAESVAKAGGTVRAQPFDVFTQGRMAQFSDPAGADFAVWQPGETRGLQVVNDPGSLCWTELSTTDPGAATAFYQEVFGWSAQETPMGEFSYVVIKARDGAERSQQGGIMPLSEQMTAAGMDVAWRPYFEVADCDAAVATALKEGGTVIAPAMDVPEVGRMASLADPAAAQFAVITSVAS